MDECKREFLPCAVYPWCRLACVARCVNDARAAMGLGPLPPEKVVEEYWQIGGGRSLFSSSPILLWTDDGGAEVKYGEISIVPFHDPNLRIKSTWCEVVLASLGTHCPKC